MLIWKLKTLSTTKMIRVTTLSGMIVCFFWVVGETIVWFPHSQSMGSAKHDPLFRCCRHWNFLSGRYLSANKLPSHSFVWVCKGTCLPHIPCSIIPIRNGGNKLRRNGVLEGSSGFCDVSMWWEGRRQERQRIRGRWVFVLQVWKRNDVKAESSWKTHPFFALWNKINNCPTRSSMKQQLKSPLTWNPNQAMEVQQQVWWVKLIRRMTKKRAMKKIRVPHHQKVPEDLQDQTVDSVGPHNNLLNGICKVTNYEE